MKSAGEGGAAIQRIYQVVLLGQGVVRHGGVIKDLVRERVSEVGGELDECLRFVSPGRLGDLVPTAPAVAVFLGGSCVIADEADAVALVSDAVPILPVVSDLKRYKRETPACLHPINGSEVDWDAPDFSAVVNVLLENLSLLRRERRLFISYRREESLAIAHQLRVAFDDAGYDTFLDLSSVPKGDDFQAVLWHRLLDSDVVVVLDTEKFLDSHWTKEEIAMALAGSVGLLRVSWPGVDRVRAAELAWPLALGMEDFAGDVLVPGAVTRVVRAAEALRARNLAARYTNVVREFCKEAAQAGVAAHVQPDRFVLAERADGTRVAVVPTVGMPDARLFHDASLRFPVGEALADEAVLLYDHLGMHDQWTRFLDWLDDHLPVKGVRVTHSARWLAGLA